jgi:hypothetical protein
VDFGSGLGGSVVGSLYGGGGTNGNSRAGGAAAPAGTSGPTGSPSLVAAAWGVQNSGQSRAPLIATLVGVGAWVGLVVMWWCLPR